MAGWISDILKETDKGWKQRKGGVSEQWRFTTATHYLQGKYLWSLKYIFQGPYPFGYYNFAVCITTMWWNSIQISTRQIQQLSLGDLCNSLTDAAGSSSTKEVVTAQKQMTKIPKKIS